MYISVKFWKSDAEGFGGRAYTYRCNIGFLQVGDQVIAPSRNGSQRAVVVDIGVPKPEFECLEITSLWIEPEKPEASDG